MKTKKIAAYLAAGLLFSSIAYAEEASTEVTTEPTGNAFTQAFKEGKPKLAFRLRHENAKQGSLHDARATTLRTTVGFETAEFSKSLIKLELVDVANFFGQRFNPGVSDLTKPSYSMIRDPRGAGITEGKFIYNGFDRNTITFGRQYIQLDNERFIGKNDFRQFPQSFDSLGVNIGMVDSLNFYYAYLNRVNTNFANGRSDEARRGLSTHIINAKWDGYQFANLIGYLYFNKDRSVRTNSHTLYGIRATGISSDEVDDLDYSVELARQQSKFGNPKKYTAYYMNFNIDKTISVFKGTAGFERLSGSSSGANVAFITPLGSVDNFNGLAQVFSTTPNRGLQDAYATISGSNPNVDITIALTYHLFRLDKGPGPKRAGQEIDIKGILKVNAQIDLTMAFARYNPKNNVAPKTTRFWVMMNANLL